jgi:hypothetical protein
MRYSRVRLTIAALALAPSVALTAPARGQDPCPFGTCSPRLAVAMVGDVAPSVTLGVFWTKTLTPPPPEPVPGAGPAPVVESHWSLRALLSAGVTFARPNDAAVDLTGFGYFGVLHDVDLGFLNRAGAVVVGSLNPDAAGLAARVEAPARVAGLQLGWVRVFDGEVHRLFASIDLSFGFLWCDVLQQCRDGT